MAAKGKRPMRALTAGDKIEAIQRVNDGESKASVARDIGVPESTLRGWCKNEDKLRYMSTRHSTPDTDKSSDATEHQPPEKRIRYDTSPPHATGAASGAVASAPDLPADYAARPAPSPDVGLDLSGATPADLSANKIDNMDSNGLPQPVELTKPKAEPSRFSELKLDALPHNDFKAKVEGGASVSMSAISPLTGLNHLSGMTGLAQNHLGMSFNDIATNLSLIAQLNPSLSALTNSITSSSKALRSIRSPKPSHVNHASSGPLNLSDKYKNGGRSHHSETYSERSRSKASHHTVKEPPVDDALWYWLKTQQAMLDLTAHSAQLPHSMAQSIPRSRSPKETNRHSPKPVAPMASVNSQLDLNKNSWFWQYYKQFGGAIPFPEDKTRSTVQAPKDKTENILYSQLTKGNTQEYTHYQSEEIANIAAPPAASAPVENREPIFDKLESAKNQSKARNVLDNLLFNNNNVTHRDKATEDIYSNSENEFDGEVSEALEHGEKFLKWLEACQDPSVTRMQVHQLKGLLNNIRTRAERKPQPLLAQDRISRRK